MRGRLVVIVYAASIADRGIKIRQRLVEDRYSLGKNRRRSDAAVRAGKRLAEEKTIQENPTSVA